jgi:hypothetical protein
LINDNHILNNLNIERNKLDKNNYISICQCLITDITLKTLIIGSWMIINIDDIVSKMICGNKTLQVLEVPTTHKHNMIYSLIKNRTCH